MLKSDMIRQGLPPATPGFEHVFFLNSTDPHILWSSTFFFWNKDTADTFLLTAGMYVGDIASFTKDSRIPATLFFL